MYLQVDTHTPRQVQMRSFGNLSADDFLSGKRRKHFTGPLQRFYDINFFKENYRYNCRKCQVAVNENGSNPIASRRCGM